MDITSILLDLAIILFATKAMGMLMRKIGLPQVVGMVIAGLLIGPAIWGQFGWWSPIRPTPESTVFFKGYCRNRRRDDFVFGRTGNGRQGA